MNRNTAIVIVVIVLAVLVGGIVYGVNRNATMPQVATSTAPVVTDTDTDETPAVQAGAPVVVTNATAAPTDTTVVMTGTAVPNGAFTAYWYEYGITSSLGMKSASQELGSGFRQTYAPAYVKGLTANSTYYFRLVAENSYGKTVGATHSFQTTQGVPAPRGSAPTPVTLAANGITRTSANLNGSVDPNQNATEYWFEYGTTQNLGNTVGFVSAGNGDAKVPVSVSVAGLQPLTTYYFRVNAQNQFGTVNGGINSFKTSGPATVTVKAPSVKTTSAGSVESTSATLRGTLSANGAGTNYWFEYSSDSLLGNVLLKSTPSEAAVSSASNLSVSADISGLSPRTTYYYRLVAENSLSTVRGDKVSFKTDNQ